MMDEKNAAKRANDHDLPQGCWISLGYSFSLVLIIGGLLLLSTLSRFVFIRRFFLAGNTIGIVVVSLLILAGGILLAIITTKSLQEL
jgi:hypothetical protein